MKEIGTKEEDLREGRVRLEEGKRMGVESLIKVKSKGKNEKRMNRTKIGSVQFQFLSPTASSNQDKFY